jgi:hypothetical protein
VALVVLGLNLFVGLTVGVAALVGGNGAPGLTGTSVARLVATPFQGTCAEMAEALGVSTEDSDDSLTVPLAGAGFAYGWVRWDSGHLEQPNGACFYATDGHPRAAEAQARLRTLFGRRLVWDKDGTASWRWGGIYVNVGANVSNLCFSSDVDDPQWIVRVRLLWSVFLAVVAEQDLSLQTATLKGWLATGYSLAELSALDLRFDVDKARGYVPTLFPGAAQEVMSGLTFEVPLNHAWFGAASLSWPNERGGTLESVRLQPLPEQQTLSAQPAVGRCLDASLGRGEVQEQDHLAGTWSERWQLRDGTTVRLDPYGVTLDLEGWPPQAGSSARRSATFRKVLAALDGCGS